MKEILAVMSRKGGNAKTTTVAAITAGLSQSPVGYKVLAIDLDGQGNLSYIMDVDPNKPTVFDVLSGKVQANDAIQHTSSGDIIPADPSLDMAESIITGSRRELRLKKVLEPIQDKYDLILIDNLPTFGILNLNSLACSSGVLITSQADVLSIQALNHLHGLISSAKKINPSLVVRGILLTRYSPRTILSRNVTTAFQNFADNIGTKLFSTRIREGIAVREAQAKKMSLFKYAAYSKPALDYARFIDELLETIGS